MRATFPAVGLRVAALDARVRLGERPPARRRAARLRRPRRDDRAARHRRRPRAPVPARPRPAGHRPRQQGRRRNGALEPAGRRRSSSATAPSSPACSSARAARPACTASRPRRPCFRSASPAGSRRPTGKNLVYGRSDQLIAGLDRAVDPNGDGDAHDAVRVALVGVTEPYAAFTQGPEALAVQGALDLNTLVVSPAGNDGAAGPTFGSVAGPAGAPGALAVGATDCAQRAAAGPRRAAPRPRRDPRPRPAAARAGRAVPFADVARRRRARRADRRSLVGRLLRQARLQPRRGPRGARAGRRRPAAGCARRGARRRGRGRSLRRSAAARLAARER